jgi:uncharacterized membrane protein (DUF373 family)
MLEEPGDAPGPPGGGRGGGPRRGVTLQSPSVLAESALYLVIGMLLVLAAGFTLVDTVVGVFRSGSHRGVADVGLFMLERTLLLFMIAELLATLRLVDFGARILVQPFLLIGMIAVVRRVLVLTAEFEGGGPDSGKMDDFLLQLAALGGLVLALALAFWLLRIARP